MSSPQTPLLPSPANAVFENFANKVFKQLENLDRQTSLKIGVVLFLVYLYNYAGFIFLIISIYRGYKVIFEPSPFLKSVEDAIKSEVSSASAGSSGSVFPNNNIEKIVFSVVKEFFGIKN